MQLGDFGPPSYFVLREELASFVAEFEGARHPGLFAERVCDAGVAAEGWAAFVAGEEAGLPAAAWVVLPSGGGCHRFAGDFAGLADFRRLAGAAWRVVATLADRFPQAAVAGADRHEDGWLELVFDTALAASTARLHVEYGRWGVAGDESLNELLPDYWVGTGPNRRPRHPHMESLAFDVFRSSAEAIRCWLDPDAVPSVGDRLMDDMPVRLPEVLPRPVEPLPDPSPDAKPVWDDDALELCFNGVLVRRFAPQAVRLLNAIRAFDAAGWPRAIDNPHPCKTAKTLGEIVDSLNEGLAEGAPLRFTRHDSGRKVRWVPAGG